MEQSKWSKADPGSVKIARQVHSDETNSKAMGQSGCGSAPGYITWHRQAETKDKSLSLAAATGPRARSCTEASSNFFSSSFKDVQYFLKCSVLSESYPWAQTAQRPAWQEHVLWALDQRHKVKSPLLSSVPVPLAPRIPDGTAGTKGLKCPQGELWSG